MRNSQTGARSERELAQIVSQVANVVQASAIICVTHSGTLAHDLAAADVSQRLIAATVNEETYAALSAEGMEAIRLPLYAADKHNQVRHVLSVAARLGKISVGDFILCAVGSHVYPQEGDLIVLTDVEPGMESVVITDLVKLTDGIRPTVLETALAVACRIGRVVRRGGERKGAIFILGDSLKVLEQSRQLVPNPFHGHEDELRRLTNPDLHDSLVEFSKLDGAFVVRGDGYIQSAGVFLMPTDVALQLPAGLGARHTAAAAITANTAATAVVVSATDGSVRTFAGGKMILRLDPDVPFDPVLRE